MKVIFAGTPDFSATALKAIAAAGFEIPLVLTQPDRPKGRGMQLQASAVKQTALELGLRVEQPEKLRNNAEALQMLRDVDADIMVVAAYGLILPQDVLDTPKHGCLNIHASILPRWRGAAPIQRAIEAGDAETGVCIMQMDIGLDTGNVVSEHRYAIKPTDTANEVHDALMALGATAIVQDLQTLQQTGSLKSTVQPEDGVTYAQKLTKEEAKINWQEPAEVVARKIRAFNPVPTAWTEWQGKPMKIWAAAPVAQNGAAGTVLAANANGIIIACGDGAVCITELQPSGSKRMTASAFLTGRELANGKAFE
ncbi:methionyl-tRNA formyltransferase [Kingella negevensis]|uniref:Methionyl-tRNA formyltransferase n=1 Tax=Kingella negevensis TaxID=1522312 RepID=A0A238TC37_9NEIS|nr:methionyl-tRNA formyltransferase [Kingella negevensis]MDK4684762.1 methionyl-tRNA formyltransferase [Kingella negevensis]MDK4697874.1 methionyl-tRNA formyltransferase [Kingella negevensis]MDK4708610.1 methionyl-tRNA formyltransferase [Kingella negevensis]MDK4710383.1 methionyl-tRNA formyltransferase [Kingella negevensis]SNB72525.1 Methionyl-tRNA formyltransferase [Kingella negevensis]